MVGKRAWNAFGGLLCKEVHDMERKRGKRHVRGLLLGD